MNNIFDIHRFGNLYMKELKEFFHKFGPSTLTLMGVYVGVWVVSLIIGTSPIGLSYRVVLLAWILFGFICLLPIKVYGEINDKKLGVNYALLPASVTEKFSLMMLNSAIIYPAVFTILMLLLDSILVFASGTRGFSGYLFTSDFIGRHFSNYCDFILLQSVFLYGALLFKTHKFSKTIGCIIGANILLVIIIIIAAYVFFKTTDLGLSYFNGDIKLDEALDAEAKELFINVLNVFKYVFTLGIPVLLWVLSFFRLKNMQYK